MIRSDIVSIVGREYLASNVENDEFSYPKAYKDASLPFTPIQCRAASGRSFEIIDLRFVKGNITVLVETKTNFSKAFDNAAEQLSAYVEYEKQLTGNKTIAILANTTNNEIMVWRGVVSGSDFMQKETMLRTIDEYVDFYTSKINDKEKVMANTYKLNELLHMHGISEKLRSQFVGTCLLALKNGLDYKTVSITTGQIRTRFKEVLETLLNDDQKKLEKLSLLIKNVLESQDVRSLSIGHFREVLAFIEDNILPFINDKITSGQDLLNLFFVTFNKYVGKSDKNQAFTPDHITDFMAKITGANKRSVILDPCCGSASFLVRAMTQALDDCATAAEQEKVKTSQIFGIEYDEDAFGLATTNMLIHSDGNTNIRQGSCFDFEESIKKTKPNIILMNPPYNAQRKHMPASYSKTWAKDKKEDPSKGLYFVKYVADTLNSVNTQATLAVLLPVACAIGTIDEIANLKKSILEENTLDAVFTLPNEVFYPGASASACCMVFKVGKKHDDVSNPDTFFGYYKDDGFKKKKNLGRVEQIDHETGRSRWIGIEQKWIELYRNRISVDGLSATHKVNCDDEWLCEAYLKTDYTKLTHSDFRNAVNEHLAFLIKEGRAYECWKFLENHIKTSIGDDCIKTPNGNDHPPTPMLHVAMWEEFTINDIFRMYNGKGITKEEIEENEGEFIAVQSGEENNGVIGKINKDYCASMGYTMTDYPCLTVARSGSAGFVSFQPFGCVVGDSSKMLMLRKKENGNPYVYLFLKTILMANKFKYTYGRKVTQAKYLQERIMLPIARKGVPDYGFMERYIKSLSFE